MSANSVIFDALLSAEGRNVRTGVLLAITSDYVHLLGETHADNFTLSCAGAAAPTRPRRRRTRRVTPGRCATPWITCVRSSRCDRAWVARRMACQDGTHFRCPPLITPCFTRGLRLRIRQVLS